MRNKIPIFILLWGSGLMTTGCLLPDKDRIIPGKSRIDTGEWTGSRPLRPGTVPEDNTDTIVYVSAAEFPQDYHWQRDTAGENRVFNLTLYRNMKKILSIKGGPGTYISSDPDMHRTIGGHLYTDFSTKDETVISMDGKELFRYGGREMLCGFMVRDGDVYTLGLDRKGTGVSFRKNGGTIFMDKDGIPFGDMSNPCSGSSGGLYELDGQIAFCYRIDGHAALMRKTRLFIVKDGAADEVQLDAAISGISDARVIGGAFCLASIQTGGQWSYPVLYNGQDVLNMPLRAGNTISNCRLMWSGNDVYLKADWTRDSWSTTYSALWNAKMELFTPDKTAHVHEYYIDGKNIAYVYTDMAESRICTRFTPDDEHDWRYTTADKSCFMGGNCAAIRGVNFYAGISSMLKGGKPVLVHNGTASELQINGFITSVTIDVAEKQPNPPKI